MELYLEAKVRNYKIHGLCFCTLNSPYLFQTVKNIFPWLPRQSRQGEGKLDCEFGNSICKLLYTEWINKVLLYSTGNYIHYPVINHNGKNMKNNFLKESISKILCQPNMQVGRYSTNIKGNDF